MQGYGDQAKPSLLGRAFRSPARPSPLQARPPPLCLLAVNLHCHRLEFLEERSKVCLGWQKELDQGPLCKAVCV